MPPDAERDWSGGTSARDDAARLAEYYDLSVGHGSEGVDWLRGLAARTGGPILELGCGTGRVAVPLARDGHRVVGVDFAPAMLERARDRARTAGADVRFVEADMRTLVLDEAFALIAIPFNTFLMLDPDERRTCLARVREHLAPKGRFALMVFQPDPERIAAQQGGVVEMGRFADPASGGEVTWTSTSHATVDRVSFTWRYDLVGDDHLVRSWSLDATLHFLYRRELELLLDAAGFAIETMHGDFDGSPVTERSPQLLTVARRRERGDGRDRRTR